MKLFRVIPITITVAVILLGVKLADMVSDTQTLFIEQVEAQQAEKPSNVSADKPAIAPDQEKGAKQTAKKPEDTKKDAKPAEVPPEKSSEKKPEEKKDKENPAVSTELGSSTDHRFTAVEIELLQSLSKRRDELDRWEANIQIKEATLDATQKRIDEKIQQIEAMKKQVAELLAKYNAQEDTKIKSLVKIYENMKPTDAARIFDEVEMPILLLVIDGMSEKKASPILAAMNSKKAKQLTVELANERKLTASKISGITPPDAPAAPPPPAK